MSEAPDTSKVEVARAWTYEGENEGIVHIELVAGGDSLPVTLKATRNPLMFEFITKHTTVTSEVRPAKPSDSQ